MWGGGGGLCTVVVMRGSCWSPSGEEDIGHLCTFLTKRFALPLLEVGGSPMHRAWHVAS